MSSTGKETLKNVILIPFKVTNVKTADSRGHGSSLSEVAASEQSTTRTESGCR